MRIDLNADLGEERGDDETIFPCISSASIACGAHAGGARSIDASLRLAEVYAVAVGAHVSYEDREHFGREPLEVSTLALRASLEAQITLLQDQAARFGQRVMYVKPHGALYHRVSVDAEHAHALAEAVRSADANLELLVPFSSVMRQAAGTLQCRHEFFADRGYHLDGRLVGRGDARAHIHSVEAVVDRSLHWLQTGEVQSVEGKPILIQAESICLHGDSPFAVRSARALRDALAERDVRVVNWMQP